MNWRRRFTMPASRCRASITATCPRRRASSRPARPRSTSRSYSSAARATRRRAARTRTTTTSRRGLGVVWSVNPKTVVRAGAGVYYAASDFNPLFRLAAGLPDNLIQTLTSNNFVPQYPRLRYLRTGGCGSRADSAGRHRYQPAHQLLPAVDVHRAARTAQQDCAGSRLHGELSASSWSRTCSRTTRSRAWARSIRAVRTLPCDYAPGTTFPSYVNVVGQQRSGGLHQLPAALRAVELSLRSSCAWRSRSRNGLSWLTSYTFSKAITNAPQFRNAGGVNGSENSPAQDAFNLRAERGLASFDTRQRLVNTVVYQLPFGRTQKYLRYGVASKVLGGWETSGIVTAQSGFPYTLNLRGDTAGVGAGTGGIFVRPNLVPGTDWQLPGDQQSTSRYFNTAAFAAPATGAFGSVGRNTLIGPGLLQRGCGGGSSLPHQGRARPAVPGGVLQHAESSELHPGGTHRERSDVRPGAEPGRPAATAIRLQGDVLRRGPAAQRQDGKTFRSCRYRTAPGIRRTRGGAHGLRSPQGFVRFMALAGEARDAQRSDRSIIGRLPFDSATRFGAGDLQRVSELLSVPVRYAQCRRTRTAAVRCVRMPRPTG